MQERLVDPLGKVYAGALLEAADAEGGLEQVRGIGAPLFGLAEAWRQQRTFRAFFLSADVGSTRKRAALERLAEGWPRLLRNFLLLLLERGRLRWIPKIADAYAADLDRRLGRVPVTLTTATAVPEDMVVPWLERLREATGLEPVLRHEVKPEILAGAILKVGDVVADGSARRRLVQLRKHILESGKHAIQA